MMYSVREYILQNVVTTLQGISKAKGYVITSIQDARSVQNDKLVFQEGAAVLTVILTDGVYTGEELASHIQAKMNAVGSLTYTVTYDSSARKFTISADGSFDLLFDTDEVTQTLGTLLGFSGDQTGASSYTSVSTTQGFLNDVGMVSRLVIEPSEVRKGDFPAMFVVAGDSRYSDITPEGVVVVETGIGVLFYFDISRAEDNPEQLCQNMIRDIKIALAKDPTRGGYALDTIPLSDSVNTGFMGDYPIGEVTFMVRYYENLLIP